MKIFRHFAEVCPNCGAIGSFRRELPDPRHPGKYLYRGKSLTVGKERRIYVACTQCGARALRITQIP